jgi:RNA polymerase-binding transcription factor DksA
LDGHTTAGIFACPDSTEFARCSDRLRAQGNRSRTILQRVTRHKTTITATGAEPNLRDDRWLNDTRARLQQQLDDLYDRTNQDDSNQDDMAVRRRIAGILQAFDLMEVGQYGVCACCGVAISKSHLEADPARDTCEACG